MFSSVLPAAGNDGAKSRKIPEEHMASKEHKGGVTIRICGALIMGQLI